MQNFTKQQIKNKIVDPRKEFNNLIKYVLDEWIDE